MAKKKEEQPPIEGLEDNEALHALRTEKEAAQAEASRLSQRLSVSESEKLAAQREASDLRDRVDELSKARSTWNEAQKINDAERTRLQSVIAEKDAEIQRAGQELQRLRDIIAESRRRFADA